MSALSDIASGLAAALCSFTLVSAAGCGTDAKGIDDCRNIEEARCESAQNCGIPGFPSVDECRRFYRDQCLHGLPVDSPGGPVVSACVAVIRAAGSCATSKDTLLSACPAPVSDEPLTYACQVVTSPELTHECSFLLPPAASGGAAGNGGSSGAAGSGGTAGRSGAAGSGGTAGASGAAGAAGAAN